MGEKVLSYEEYFVQRMTPKVRFYREPLDDDALVCRISWNGICMKVDASSIDKRYEVLSPGGMKELGDFADILFLKFCFELTSMFTFDPNGKPIRVTKEQPKLVAAP